MRKLFLSGLLLIVVVYTEAQNRYNFFAGPQAITSSYSVRGSQQSTDFKFGLQAGIGAKIEFDNQLYFAPAIYYSYKGYKVSLTQAANPPDLTAVNNNLSVHTLETAFLLQYDFNKNPSHFFVKLGPSLDFQLAGKEKYDQVDGGHVSRSMVFDFSHYGRYAASAILQVGYETSAGLLIYAHYAHGLSNLNNADAGPSIYYRTAGISIGKYFK